MTSNLSGDIEHEKAIEDTKLLGTWIIILFHFVPTVSLGVCPKMAALKNIRKFGFLSTPVKLSPHFSLKQTPLNSHGSLSLVCT